MRGNFQRRIFFILLTRRLERLFHRQAIISKIGTCVQPRRFRLARIIVARHTGIMLLCPTTAYVFNAGRRRCHDFRLYRFILTRKFTDRATHRGTIRFHFIHFDGRRRVRHIIERFATIDNRIVRAFNRNDLRIDGTTGINVKGFTRLHRMIIGNHLFSIRNFIQAPTQRRFSNRETIFNSLYIVLREVSQIVNNTSRFRIRLLRSTTHKRIVLHRRFIAFIPSFVND